MPARAGPLGGETAFTHPLQGGPPSEEDDSPEFSRSSSTSYSSPAIRRMAMESTPSGLDGLKYLAAQSSWRAVVQQCKEMQGTAAEAQSVGDKLKRVTFHVLGLTKLRMYGAAKTELKTVGDLDQAEHQYTNAQGLLCSHVPFALRYLACELNHHLGQPEACMNALYVLMHQCRQEIEFAGSPSGPASTTPANCEHNTNSSAAQGGGGPGMGRLGTGEEGAQCWWRRQDMVLYTLLNHHIVSKDFGVVLQWLDKLLEQHPEDPVILSRVGYVLLQLGDVDGAKACFGAVEEQGEKEGGSEGPEGRVPPKLVKGLIHRNAGILKFAQKDFMGALSELGVAIECDPEDISSVNNYALCLMYTRDLMGATRYLEETLRSDPEKYLDETLVLNLCSMYELTWSTGTESKRKLSSWVSKIVLDDFDLTCTRL